MRQESQSIWKRNVLHFDIPLNWLIETNLRWRTDWPLTTREGWASWNISRQIEFMQSWMLTERLGGNHSVTQLAPGAHSCQQTVIINLYFWLIWKHLFLKVKSCPSNVDSRLPVTDPDTDNIALSSARLASIIFHLDWVRCYLSQRPPSPPTQHSLELIIILIYLGL